MCLAVTVVLGADEKGVTDDQFVELASAAGLAEVNLGYVAAKQATDPAVKAFAKHMVDDHTKANAELIDLANKKKWKVAARMDAEHQMMEAKLLKLTGAAFDREYVAGQVKDHKVAVSLFEKEAKGGRDADLKNWAEKTLPTLRAHLKHATEVHDKLGGGAGKTGETGKPTEKSKSP